MSSKLERFVDKTCSQCESDRNRLMDIVRAVQEAFGCVDGPAIERIATRLGIHRVEVESVVSFYAFLSTRPKGRVVVRLCNDLIDEMNGAAHVAEVFADELGIRVGETTPDGRITLETTPCIGMCDQAPAALINDVVITNLDGEKARAIALQLKQDGCEARLIKTFGDGNNADPLVQAMVVNNIRLKGPVLFDAFAPGSALEKALAMTPAEVVRDIKTSRLRGRGGAGFPTGMKWDFTRQAAGETRYVICNADEGEPGTFKDRVILTECADLLLEGMTIAGYAIGASSGVLYLRGEYAYLRAFLEHKLRQRREKGLLGSAVARTGVFRFDIRIQMGAGAYVCGEETALISSCEGLRGDPRNRPPFPAQKGFKDCPTTVNNVETLCCVARILDKGPGWFAQLGSKASSGTKLLSVSGDCSSPGVYEIPLGITLRELLATVGAADAAAVQVGGPSGHMVGPDMFDRTLCFDDLATGGAVLVFGPSRNVVAAARKFMEFFVEESCGYCTPCRAGNGLLKQKLDDILEGRGTAGDLAYLEELGKTIKLTSRCGLGQTAPNPVLSTLANFRPAYDKLTREPAGGDVFLASFDIHAALRGAKTLIGRDSGVFN